MTDPKKPKGKPKAKRAKREKGLEDEFGPLPPVGPADAGAAPGSPAPTPQELKRKRIFEIAQLMVSGEWRAHMARSLGKRWGLETKTVQHYSAEASRLCDYTTGQRETLVKIARVRLLEIAHQDENDRVPAIRTILENLGELRQNILTKAADPFEGWTDEEIQFHANTGELPERLRPRKPKKDT